MKHTLSEDQKKVTPSQRTDKINKSPGIRFYEALSIVRRMKLLRKAYKMVIKYGLVCAIK